MARSWAPLIVTAIQFGTTYSGCAYSFNHEFENVSVISENNERRLKSDKAPTCILIKPDGKTLEAFGCEAEYKYGTLSEEGSHKQWYFFQRSKLMLLNKPIHKDTMLDDECGKPLPALRVFSLAIRYIVDDVLKIFKTLIRPQDIHWVLTVPAIWHDASKDFMRLAAKEAGLLITHITIVEEPVAASFSCIENGVQKERLELLPGHKFLVLDAGRTVDIAVYKVCFGGKLKEVYKATDEFCGGAMVDKAIEDFLADLTGRQPFERFKKENMRDYMDLMREFKFNNRYEDMECSGKYTIIIRPSIIDLVNDTFDNTFRKLIQSSRYTNHVQLVRNKLRVDASIIRSFFKQSIDSIHTLLAAALRQFESSSRVDTILMVGGYSESPILQKATKEKFTGMKVIVSSAAGIAVLKGAVIFGHRPIDVSYLKLALIRLSVGHTVGSSDAQSGVHLSQHDNTITLQSIVMLYGMVVTSDKTRAAPAHDVNGSKFKTGEPQRPSWSAMPSNWEPMKPDEIFRQVRLSSSADEFQSVLSNFIQTLDNREILTIHRIQSKFLWEHYCVKKKEMEKINGIDGADEKILFHGTKPDIIESICAENLDMRLAGSNVGAAILGHGTYFATAAKMSNVYATPDPKSGHRYMLQCRVLVGKWTKGQADLKRPPEIAASASDGYRKRYNSCVDNVLKPSIFCIFDHVQYYPEYVIEYE